MTTPTALNVADFGAYGDGAHDDTVAIQNAVNAAMQQGVALCFTQPLYNISSEIECRPVVGSNIGSSFPSSEAINFTPGLKSLRLFSNCRSVIRATASMNAVLNFVYNASVADAAPYFGGTDGLVLDGGNFANYGIFGNWCYAMRIEHTGIERCAIGIVNNGYGEYLIENNQIFCPICVQVQSGGDTDIIDNNFWPSNIAIDLQQNGGDMYIARNVFNRDDNGSVPNAVLIGVNLNGTLSIPNGCPDVYVGFNEFDGFDTAVMAHGNTESNNTYNLLVTGNHTRSSAAGAGHNTAVLLEAHNVFSVNVKGNFINSSPAVAATDIGVKLYNCTGGLVEGNIFTNVDGACVYIKDSDQISVLGNSMRDTGKLGTTYPAVCLDGATKNCLVNSNNLFQSNPAFGQLFLQELGTSDCNEGYANKANVTTKYAPSGAHSTFS